MKKATAQKKLVKLWIELVDRKITTTTKWPKGPRVAMVITHTDLFLSFWRKGCRIFEDVDDIFGCRIIGLSILYSRLEYYNYILYYSKWC